MNTHPGRILIIGASRGIGLALAAEYLKRDWEVIATVRTPSPELSALATAALRIEALDIDEPDQLLALRNRLGNEKLQLLFISAGTTNWPDKPASQVDQSEINRVMNTNAFSPIRVADALLDLVTDDGTIAFMSSSLASITNNTTAGTEVYRASKVALNMLVRCFAVRHAEPARTMLLLHPGWVQTDMGGPRAPMDATTSANGLANAIEGRKNAGGCIFVDYKGRELPW
jgi:NAD(P)-dependent dehydrogenase (short-subunit alcohol dehydrogenase family)